MKIESNIKSILNKTGKVVIPELGTFTTAQASAAVTEAGGVIAPPQATIQFSEDTSELDNYSLEKFLVAAGIMDESDAALELEAFTKGIKNTVASSGKAGIASLGYFQKGAYGLEFVASDVVGASGDSFGLPKITARPLMPVPITDDAPKPSGDKLLLKAILIPLVLLAFVLVFFMINKEAYQSLVGYFSSPDQEIVDNSGNNGTSNDGANNGTSNTDKDDNGGEDTKTDKSDGKTPDANSDKKDNNTPKNDDTNTTDKDVVADNTTKFYIIIGSFTNTTAANKKIKECKRIGFPNAEVLKMNGRIRVSVEAHTDRATAEAKAKKLGKDFPGAWVLAN